MPFIIPSNTITGGYEVDNSCRFNSADSAYLSRTPSSAGNRRTYTGSVWVKRSKLDTFNFIFDADNGTAQSQNLLFGFVNQTLVSSSIYNQGTGATVSDATTSAVFRDTSAWYHLCVAVDTTQSTASDRIKVYVNGTQITSFGSTTYMTQNYETGINATCPHSIGRWQDDGSRHFDGYLAEFVFIDGTALDPTSFGEFDEDSPTIWKPKAISGLTFGTNGFYLDFKDSSALGNDVSGNNNDFTSNNLTATDQSTDTCTNNFCTLNYSNNQNTLSEGNLKAVTGTNTGTAGTMGFSSGKWYFEVKVDTAGGSFPFIGVVLQDRYPVSSVGGGTARWIGNGGLSDGDIVGFAVDLDSNTFNAYIDGTILTEPSSYINTSDGTITAGNWIPALSGVSSTFSCNFGSPPYSISSGNSDANGYGNFEYAVPSGYYAICTKNLAEFG